MSDERKLQVARALFDYDHGGFNDGPMWEDDEGARLHYLGAADAAIAALGGVGAGRTGADVEALVVAMAENYEMYADEGHYMPNDHERTLLVDFSHEVAEALGREPSGGRWATIESAPKDYSRVLLTEGGAVAVGFYDVERREWMNDSGWVYGLCGQPTHWAPLPAPPSKEG